jgi:hypothetical protein
VDEGDDAEEAELMEEGGYNIGCCGIGCCWTTGFPSSVSVAGVPSFIISASATVDDAVSAEAAVSTLN